VEGMTTSKIIDNTVVSAFIKILCIDMFEICCNEYHFSTSIEVYYESKRGFSKGNLNKVYKRIEIVSKKEDSKYEEMIAYLKNRYPYLHEGELSSFLIALLDYEMVGKKYFYITDDGKMKKRVPEILNSQQIIKLLKGKVTKFYMTGTIGLIRRICQKGYLSQADIDKIVLDLRNSTFYISDKLLRELRGCLQ
jgi:predicted nucleic acid-binding protein